MSEIVWLARTVKNHLETKSFTSIGTMAALITIAGDRAAAHPLESLFLIGLGIAAICEKPNEPVNARGAAASHVERPVGLDGD